MIPRRALLLGLPLAACASDEPATLPRLVQGYRHLTPLRLNVAELVIAEPAAGAVSISQPAPLRPDAEMRRMAEERIIPSGTSGSARFVIRAAEFRRERLAGSGGITAIFAGDPGERLTCRVALLLEVRSAEGQAGQVEAEARRTRTLPEGTSQPARRRAAEEIVRQAMDDLNVEFEFQLRRVLGSWLVDVAVPPPAPVETETLPRPRPR
jgi:hypothetical protein